MPSAQTNPTTPRTLRLTATLIAALALLAASAHANSPELRNIQPVGAQRGQELTVNFHGPRVGDAAQLLSHDSGIEATAFEKVNDNRVRITLAIADDAPLGEHRLRLRTPRGVTNLYAFQIGTLPTVTEEEPNSLFEDAQSIAMNTTAHGVVTDEDVDYYRVEAREGQRIVAEAQAMRLGRVMFDPHVTIFDSNRFTLAASDGTAFSGQDGVAAAIAPADGEYVIAIRESAYGGGGNHHYRLHVGDFPRPLVAFPLGGRPGEQLDVTFIGDPAGDLHQTLTLPDEPTDRYGAFPEDEHGIAQTPNPLRVSDMPAVRVSTDEPPLSRPNAQVIEHAPPFAIDGILAGEGDMHWMRFEAREGQTLDVNTFARDLGSPIDTVIAIHNADGQQLEANDDNGDSLDSYIRFRVPADGEYYVRVWDHLRRGGPEFAYRLEVALPRPGYAVRIPNIGRNDTQGRQWVAVPRGNRWSMRVRIDRQNIGGDVELSAENLPEGVTMHAPVVPDGINEASILFEAEPDAPLDGRMGRIIARHPEREDVTGHYGQDVLMTHRNNLGTFHATQIAELPIVVTEQAPYRIRIDEPGVPLLQNGPMQLRIVAERDEGFTAPIRVQLEYRPPGFNARAHVEIPEGQDEVAYPVNAGGNARTGEYRIAALASAPVDGGPLFVGSQLATLETAARRFDGEIQLVAVERGDTARVPVELHPLMELEGEATLVLHGLPPEATSEPVAITAEDEDAIFEVQTTENTPVGQHQSLYVEFRREIDGEAMTHHFAHNGRIRVDEPREPEPEPEPEPEAAEEPEPEAEPEPEPERPLSRLEQLRQEVGGNE